MQEATIATICSANSKEDQSNIRMGSRLPKEVKNIGWLLVRRAGEALVAIQNATAYPALR